MAKSFRPGVARKLVNVMISALLRAGIPLKSTYLLTVVGRRSGKQYTTPVTLVEHGSERWLVAPYGIVGWVRNARAAGHVALTRGRRSQSASIEELGPVESAPILKQYLTKVTVVRPYFDVTPQSPLEAFVAEAPRHPVFRIVE